MSTSTAAFVADWRTWHAEREQALTTEHGWLSLTALHWLSAQPEPVPKLPGRWWQDAEGIHVRPDAGAAPGLQLDGQDLTAPTTVWHPEAGAAGELTHGELLVEPLARGQGNRGLRVRDPQAPTRTGFTGIPVFEPDPAWRVPGTYVAYPETRSEQTGSAAAGIGALHDLRGQVHFRLEGQDLTLQVGQNGHIAFRDATSGAETFGMLRHLRLIETADGVVVDFNRAVNPPCAFTDFGTCPLPPAQNVLPVAIRAGERTPAR